MIQAPGVGDNAVGADAAESRFESDQPAQRRRCAHRTAGIGADRRGAEAVSERRRGTAAGTAGEPGRVVGIGRRAVDLVFAGGAVGEFVQVVLADENGARLFQPPDDIGILLRDVIGEYPGSTGGRQAGDVDQVLAGVGDAAKRLAGIDILPDSGRPGARGLEVEADEGLAVGAEPCDTIGV